MEPTKTLRRRAGATAKTPQVLLARDPGQRKTWMKLVDESPTPDVYFRPGYAAAYSGEHATAIAVVIRTSRRRFLLPLLVRDIGVLPLASRAVDYDAITPYGYGGVLPLDPGEVSSGDAGELVEQLRAWCNKVKIVSCLLRLHPLLAQHSAFSAGTLGCAGVAIHNLGRTVAVDLLAWDEHLCSPANMRKGRRSDLKHARRHLTFRLTSSGSPQAAEMLQQFRSLYARTMTRLNAAPFYFFPENHYLSLQTMPDCHLAVGIAYESEQPVGAAIFLAGSQFGHYHLSGVTDEGKRHKAQTMVLVEGAQWLRRRGCRWFHLGGGRAPDDSLYAFKNSFGARTFHCSHLTLIANAVRYNELVDLHRAGKQAGNSGNHFFPAYRTLDQ